MLRNAWEVAIYVTLLFFVRKMFIFNNELLKLKSKEGVYKVTIISEESLLKMC